MRIPKSWRDITIRQFTKALAIEKMEYEYPIEKQVAWLAALTDSTAKELEAMSIKELIGMAQKLDWVNKPEFEEKIPRYLYLKRKLYRVCTDISKINAGQLIDLCTFMQDEPMMNIHKLMATVCIPQKGLLIRGKYDGAKHEQTSKLFFDELTMDKVYPVALFFSRLYNAYLENMLIYLESEKNKLMEEAITDLRKLTEEKDS